MFYFIITYLLSRLHTKLFYKDYIETLVEKLEKNVSIEPKSYNMYFSLTIPIKVLFYSFVTIYIYNLIGHSLFLCIVLSFLKTYISNLKTKDYNLLNFFILWVIYGFQFKHYEDFGFSMFYFLQILRFYPIFKLHLMCYETIYLEKNKETKVNHLEAQQLKIKRIMVK